MPLELGKSLIHARGCNAEEIPSVNVYIDLVYLFSEALSKSLAEGYS